MSDIRIDSKLRNISLSYHANELHRLLSSSSPDESMPEHRQFLMVALVDFLEVEGWKESLTA